MYNFDEVLDRSALSATKMLPQQDAQQGCIPLWIADMDFPAAQKIQEALVNRIRVPNYGYTNRTERYDQAAIDWMDRRHSWKVEREWLVTTAGVVPAMAYAVQAVLKPGEKVIIQPPVYPMFSKMIKINDAEVVSNPLQLVNGCYEIDFEDFEQKAKDPQVKLFFLCNPHNPVGRVWTREELQRLAEICLAHDVKIFSDDIHHDIVLSGMTYTPIASLSADISNITITATSPSKTFSLAGFKMGNIWIENEQLREAFRTCVQRTSGDHLDLGAIEASIAAYTQGEQWLAEVLQYVERNNEFVNSFMAERIPQIKTFDLEGTYLKWLDFRALGMDDQQLHEWSLQEAKVWFNDGYSFGSGGSGFNRMNLASARSVIAEALEQIERAVKAL
ncbi:MalY/PatB family protein [Paenibacillus marinisediminis]